MKEIQEVVTTHVDEEANNRHVDVYFKEDDGEQGTCVAIICQDTGKVFYIDNMYRASPEVTKAIEQAKTELYIWYIVAWERKIETHTEEGSATEYEDEYRRYENKADAVKKYNEVMELDDLQTLSLCIEIDGTDH